MTYQVHSHNSNGEITIRPIQDGLIVTYSKLLDKVEKHFDNLDELQEWLALFYREGK